MTSIRQLPKFDISKLRERHFTAMIVGKRATGKGVLIRDILYQIQYCYIGTAVSPIEQVTGEYAQIMPSNFIHYVMSQSYLENVLEYQTDIYNTDVKLKANTSTIYRLLQNIGAPAPAPAPAPPPKQTADSFMVLDNCDNEPSYKKFLPTLFARNIPLKLNIILAITYPFGIYKVRENLDYVFLLRNSIINERRKLYDYFCKTLFSSFNEFDQVFIDCTKNYGCLVICNQRATVNTPAHVSSVFWYKADLHDDFYMCDDTCWQNSSNIEVITKIRQQRRTALLKSEIMEAYARKTMHPRNLQPLLDNPDEDVDAFMTAYINTL